MWLLTGGKFKSQRAIDYAVKERQEASSLHSDDKTSVLICQGNHSQLIKSICH
jgi:hypothetical protein